MTSVEKKRMIKTKRRLQHEANRKYKRKWGMSKSLKRDENKKHV